MNDRRPEQRRLAFAKTLVAERRPPPQSVAELLLRAEALAGKQVAELARALGVVVPSESRRAKGFVGQLVERALGTDPTAGDRPDFSGLGVELKTVPVRDGRPAESTFCCSIRMDAADREVWATSRLRLRLARVLFVPVEAPRQASVAARRFGRPVLWEPDAETQAALAADWDDLMGAIGTGRTPAPQQGRLLQVRPKASNSRQRAVGTLEDGAGMRLPLGFYLRPELTAHILARGLALHRP